jgi:PEP-CTERM motif
MKKVLVFGALLALACFGFAGVAKADSTSAGGVIYTFTNSGSDGGSGFLVTLTIDATNPTASGSLTKFAVQFFTNGSSASNASLTTAPSGWAVAGFGNVNQCGTGNLPFICSSGPAITITSGVNSGTYTFVFDVTGLSGAPNLGDIQAFQGQGALAISNNVGIGGPPTTTPEPASMLLLGLGLAGAPFLRRRRS